VWINHAVKDPPGYHQQQYNHNNATNHVERLRLTGICSTAFSATSFVSRFAHLDQKRTFCTFAPKMGVEMETACSGIFVAELKEGEN
jgi:hypothetical protein